MAHFNPTQYPIVTRIIDGYLDVSSPDFGIHIFKRFDEISRAEQIGSLILDVMKKVAEEGRRHSLAGKSPPPPSLSRTALGNLEKADLGISDAARIAGTSKDTLRRAADAGLLEMQVTRGGHRKFKRSACEKFRLAQERRVRSPDTEGAARDLETQSALSEDSPLGLPATVGNTPPVTPTDAL